MKGPRPRVLTEEEKEAVVAAYQQLNSLHRTAEETGIGYRVVYRTLDEAGVLRRRPRSAVTDAGAPVMRALGAELRERRTAQALALRGVAHRARLDVNYLLSIERADHSMPVHALFAICGALGVPVSEVVRSVEARLAEAGSSDANAPKGGV